LIPADLQRVATYPYLLRGLRIDRPNQVCCADITHLPMRWGFLHLGAIINLQTRKVLRWRISKTLEADFCVKALTEAIHRFGPPEIMKADQGSQFTPIAWADGLKRVGTRIAMAGKGRWITFYNHLRPQAAHGGQPPAVVYFIATQSDRQVQAVASINPKSVQELGSSSVFECSLEIRAC
jgi:putative transposase